MFIKDFRPAMANKNIILGYISTQGSLFLEFHSKIKFRVSKSNFRAIFKRRIYNLNLAS